MELSNFLKNLKSKIYSNLLVFVPIILSIFVYSNMLNGEFQIVDDKDLIVENPQIRNIPEALKTLEVSDITNALIFNIFGLNATAYHTLSLLIHIINIVLAYILINRFFGKEVSLISTSLFSIHPATVEAISWISGRAHLVTTFFGLITILSFINEKKNNSTNFPWKTLGIFLLATVVHKNIWLSVIPFVLLVIDQFLSREKPLNTERLALFLVPIILLVVSHGDLYNPKNRIPDQFNRKKGALGILRNQEDLVPVVEGWPFTLFSALKLYTFPSNLMIYYDGNPVTKLDKISMYTSLVLYVGAVWILFKIKKESSKTLLGLLLLPTVTLLPALSPLKVTWYIAERYLYFGSIFFSALLAIGILYTKTKHKNLPLIITAIILSCYAYKGIDRNKDWKSPIALAMSTIKTSPEGVRGYNDMGNAFYFKDNYEQSLYYYNIALIYDKYSDTAIKNIGLIMFQYGPEYLDLQQKYSTVSYNSDKLPIIALGFFEDGDDLKALYFANAFLKEQPNDPNALELIGEIYIRGGQLEYGKEIFLRILQEQPNREQSLLKLGYIEFQQKNYEKSLEHLLKLQSINPDNPNVLEYIKMVEKELQE